MCSRPFETRSLPSSLASTHRGFAFYVAFPKSSIRPLGLPIYVARVPSAPLMRSDPASLICYPHRLDRPTRSFPRLGSRAKHLTFAKTGCPFCARYARPIPPNTLRREIARQRLTHWPLLCYPAISATKISLHFSPAPTHQLD